METDLTTEEKLLSLAENYYLDLRGSFDESIDKVSSWGCSPTAFHWRYYENICSVLNISLSPLETWNYNGRLHAGGIESNSQFVFKCDYEPSCV